jgi:hypothetical protein
LGEQGEIRTCHNTVAIEIAVAPISGAAQAAYERSQIRKVYVAVGIHVTVVSDVVMMHPVAMMMVLVMHRAGIVMMLKRMVVMRVRIVVDRGDVMVRIDWIVMRKMMIDRGIARMFVVRHGMVHRVVWDVMVQVLMMRLTGSAGSPQRGYQKK